MSRQKMTPWFPPHIKPVRNGAYNASVIRNPRLLRWWDGRRGWSMPYSAFWNASEIAAARERPAATGRPIEWRGLAEKPE